MSEKSQTPTTEPSVVAYIDLLGTRRETIDAFRQGKQNEYLRALVGTLDTMHNNILAGGSEEWSPKEWKSFAKSNRWTVKAFTDNVIIHYPIRNVDSSPYVGEAEIVDVLRMLSYAQFFLMKSGYLVRGAIAIGDTYINDTVVFGKALIDAYIAESEVAIYPRIILTDSALEYVFRNLSGYVGYQLHDDWLLRDNDDIVFLNYLDPRILFVENESGPWFEELDAHRDAIYRRLTAYSAEKEKGREDARVLQKLLWMANYHNYFCKAHESIGDGYYIVSPLLSVQAGRFRSFRQNRA
ncbi:MAG: hypothetical protein ACYDBB_04925 [Armatimonadota bacterium]